VLATGRPEQDVSSSTRAPGRPLRWFSVNAQPAFEPGGQRVRAVVVSFTDTTERRTMLAQIEAHQQDLQQRVDERTAELRDANAAAGRGQPPGAHGGRQHPRPRGLLGA
jgi:hypothetical protein